MITNATQMVVDTIHKAEHAYVTALDTDAKTDLQQAIAYYQQALQIFNDELSPAERATVQQEYDMDKVLRDMAEVYNQLLAEGSQAGTAPFNANYRPETRRPSRSFIWLVGLSALLIVAIISTLTVYFTASAASTAEASTNCVAGSVHINGSTALQPLVSAVGADYMAECRGAHINIAVPGDASLTGLIGVEDGSLQIADSDIFAQPAQYDLVDHQVAVVIFALVINQDVTGVHDLNTEQIRGIYTGLYTNWQQVGGPDLKIVPLSRTPNSGTRYTFQKYVLNGVETVAGIDRTTAPDADEEVAQTPGSISYTTLDKAQTPGKPGTKILTINNVAPTLTTVQNNTYPFWNIEHMYTKGQPDALSQAFLSYMLKDGPQQIRERHGQNLNGYLNLSEITPIMRASRLPAES